MNKEILVLSGGGTKGIAFIGALQYLENENILKHIKTYVGTSIGSLICLLCCLNYSLNEIMDLINKLDFKKVIDISLDTILDFPKTFGIDTGETFTKFIKILIKKKVKNENITFIELFNISNLHLSVTGTCLNSCNTEFYDHIKTPDMEVYKAIRISTCFPFYFKSYEYNGKLYTDGGVSNHYPISTFPSSKTIGILLCDTTYDSLDKIDDLLTFINCIFQSSFKNIQEYILNNYKENTIFIDINDSSMNFSMDKEHKGKIFNIGYEAAKDYFINHDNYYRIKDVGVNTNISNPDNIEKKDVATSTEDLYTSYIEYEIDYEINKHIENDLENDLYET